MTSAVHRLSGLAVAALGAAVVLWLVPAHTETVDTGWMRPQTLPRLCGLALILLGLVQAVGSGPVALPPRAVVGRTARAFAVAVAGLWAMAQTGFVWAAPPLALVLMLLTGERRPAWLAGGTVLVPAAIWAVVVPLLGRSLP